MSPSLSEQLEELGHEAVRLVEGASSDSGFRKRVPIQELRPKVENFKYENGALSSISLSYTHQTLHVPFIQCAPVLVGIELAKHGTFKKCLATLTQQACGHPQSDLEGCLMEFCGRMVTGKPGEADLSPTRIIVDFLDFVFRRRLKWNIVFWIGGIGIGDDEIHLDDEILLRKPVPADFDKPTFQGFNLRSHVEGRGLDGSGTFPDRMPLPSLVYESVSHAVDLETASDSALKDLDALRLFRTGAIRIINDFSFSENWMARRCFFPWRKYQAEGWRVHEEWMLKPLSHYIVAQDEVTLFRQRYRKIRSAIDALYQQNDSPNGGRSIGIAWNRFCDCLAKPITPEERITLAITSMESLLLKSTEKGELAHRLAQRIAKLLSFGAESPIKVYREFSEAYDVRSRYIHGAGSANDPGLERIGSSVVSYARRALAMFLLLAQEKKKDEIIKRIDNSMLDAAANEKLATQVKALGVAD